MTLRELIKCLEAAEPDKVVPYGFDEPHSYRGYYDELAFEPTRDISVGEMLAAAKSAIGKTFKGYKGGDYVMKEYTDVWIARWGEEGDGISHMLMLYMLGDGVKVKRAVAGRY